MSALSALLDEPGLIDHQHAAGRAEMPDHIGPHVVTDPVVVPGGPVEEPLHPVRRRIPGRLRGEAQIARRFDALKCPFCSTMEDKVIDSREGRAGDLIRRRRECLKCGRRYTTYERVEEVMPLVIKKDGRREPYSREKVLAGLKKACQKRTVAMAKIEELVGRIEKEIQNYGQKEIPL